MPYVKSFLSPTWRSMNWSCEIIPLSNLFTWMAHKISHTWRHMLGQVSSGQTQQTAWVFMDGYTWQHIYIFFHTCYINNLFLDVACTSSPNEAVQYPTKRNNLFDHCSQESWNTRWCLVSIATLAAALKSWDFLHASITSLCPSTPTSWCCFLRQVGLAKRCRGVEGMQIPTSIYSFKQTCRNIAIPMFIFVPTFHSTNLKVNCIRVCLSM